MIHIKCSGPQRSSRVHPLKRHRRPISHLSLADQTRISSLSTHMAHFGSQIRALSSLHVYTANCQHIMQFLQCCSVTESKKACPRNAWLRRVPLFPANRPGSGALLLCRLLVIPLSEATDTIMRQRVFENAVSLSTNHFLISILFLAFRSQKLENNSVGFCLRAMC